MYISQPWEIKLWSAYILPLLLRLNEVRRKRMQEPGKRVRGRPHSLCQESHKKTKPHNCNTCSEGPDQSHEGSLVGGSVFMCSHEARSVVPFMFLHGSVGLSGSHNRSSPHSVGFPEVHLMFGCGSLHQLLGEASLMTTGLSINL